MPGVATRLLRASPRFVSVVVLSTAVGIGACTLVLSLVEGATLEPRLYPAPEQLVTIMETTSGDCRDCADTFSPVSLHYFREGSRRSLAALAAYQGTSVDLGGGASGVTVAGTRVGPDFFATLAVRPLLGRTMDAHDDRPGAPPVALLAYGTWQQRYGGSRDALGMPLRVDGVVHTIIGVMPRGFAYPHGARIWLSRSGAPVPAPNDRVLAAVGRLAEGIPLTVARTELALAARHAERDDPRAHEGRGVFVTPLLAWSREESGASHWVLVGAVALAFLVACTNVANLHLVRAIGREKEIVIRTALGADAGMIARQMLSESLLLACVGGGLGVVLAVFGVEVASRVAERWLGVPVEIEVSGIVLAGSVGLSLLVGIAFGLVSLLHLRRVDQASALRGGSVGISQGRRHRRMRTAMVVGQMILVVALSAGAVLFTSSYMNMARYDVGFDAANVLLAEVRLERGTYPEPAQLARLGEELTARLRHIPGTGSVAVWSSHFLPLKYQGASLREAPITVEGLGEILSDRAVPFLSLDGTPGTLRTLGIRVVRGRDVTSADDRMAEPVVLVNEAAARRYWPGENPLGKRLKLGPAASSEPWLTVVGVTDATVLPHTIGLGLALVNPGREWPQLYRPYAQAATRNLSVAVRATDDPGSLTPQLRRAIEDVLGSGARARYGIMRRLMTGTWQLPAIQLRAALLSAFAVIGITLALIGIHAMVAESVQSRTREIAIRVALGAGARDVLWVVLREALALAALGLAGGVALTALLVHVAARAVFGITPTVKTGLLFGLSPTDPCVYLLVGIGVVVVVLAASLVPARRALDVDLAIPLRAE